MAGGVGGGGDQEQIYHTLPCKATQSFPHTGGRPSKSGFTELEICSQKKKKKKSQHSTAGNFVLSIRDILRLRFHKHLPKDPHFLVSGWSPDYPQICHFWAESLHTSFYTYPPNINIPCPDLCTLCLSYCAVICFLSDWLKLKCRIIWWHVSQ